MSPVAAAVTAAQRGGSAAEGSSGEIRVRPWIEHVIAALVPATVLAVGLAQARPTSDATHDEGIVRVLGLGSAGIWREFDAIVGVIFGALPVSTPLGRATLSSAVGAALAAAVLYRLTRGLLAKCATTVWLGPFVAVIATLAATLGNAWQTEATSPGGSTWTALFPLFVVMLVSKQGPADKRARAGRFAAGALACGLALSAEPLVGFGALATFGVMLALEHDRPKKWQLLPIGGLLALGLALPIILALARRRVSPFALPAPSWKTGWLGAVDATTRGDLVSFAHTELGWVALGAMAAGVALAALVPKARSTTAGLVLLLVLAAGSIALGAPAGPDRFAGAPLVATAAAYALAAVGMQAAVRSVARANVPFAQASAAMIVVLELTFPAIALDESSLHATERKNRLGARWDDEALGPLPEHAILVISNDRVMRHLTASQAARTLRSDLVVLSLGDIGSPATLRALTEEPLLAPLVRDVALTGNVTEYALASLSEVRPLFVMHDPKWDKSLTRHLVPAGVLDSFEPEPHGRTDRQRALEAFLPLRQKLEKELALPRDPEMTAITAALMHARLEGLVAIGERETLPRAIDDVRAFAPGDALASSLVMKLVMSHGPLTK